MPGSKKEMFYCGIDDADCRYALPVGYDYLCRHSDSHAFAVTEDFGRDGSTDTKPTAKKP